MLDAHIWSHVKKTTTNVSQMPNPHHTTIRVELSSLSLKSWPPITSQPLKESFSLSRMLDTSLHKQQSIQLSFRYLEIMTMA